MERVGRAPMYLYTAEVYRDLSEESYVAIMVSQCAPLRRTLQVGRGRTPSDADAELRKGLVAALGRECFPLGLHIVPGYYCLHCRLHYLSQRDARTHRQERHGGSSTSSPQS